MTVVVAGAVERDGRYLAARRTRPDWACGRWEFPGGKAEAGESDAEALARELREELGVETQVLHRIPGEWPLHDDLVLHLYVVQVVEGEPVALDHHDALAWLAPAEFATIPWLESDLPAVAALRESAAAPRE